jgi:hypothetical protein
MLETAKNQKVPSYIEMTFHISKKHSETFWADKELQNEHEQLFNEWEQDGKSRYTKKFYGINFAIQFNHNS